jgi:hypothetical protein
VSEMEGDGDGGSGGDATAAASRAESEFPEFTVAFGGVGDAVGDVGRDTTDEFGELAIEEAVDDGMEPGIERLGTDMPAGIVSG